MRRVYAATAHEDAKGAAFLLAVAVEVESGRATHLNITMPEDLVAEVDAYSKRRGLSRSAFLARAARQGSGPGPAFALGKIRTFASLRCGSPQSGAVHGMTSPCA
jgi:hypothetical protein